MRFSLGARVSRGAGRRFLGSLLCLVVISLACVSSAQADAYDDGYRDEWKNCILIPQDLEGITFGIFCNGRGPESFQVRRKGWGVRFWCPKYETSTSFWEKQGGSYQNEYAEDLTAQNLIAECQWDEGRTRMVAWLERYRKNGGPDTGTINSNPCLSLTRTSDLDVCADVTKSNFENLETNPCKHRLPGSTVPVLTPSDQIVCRNANYWFELRGGGRGDKNSYSRYDYSAPSSFAGPIGELLGLAVWVGILCCFMAVLWCVAQLAMAYQSGGHVGGGVLHALVGALLVGSASGIIHFVLIG
ncbi:hypothetical protein [Embleya hyalina]|uniref:hypothetical protein n=1 Tax=Embleya hyalina TaxID=516124 RepID=UPI000F837436|nr:hypothetical protein [Embleya hyalina]